jgi:tetratricopeptide (TPR) repeat protein
MKKIKHLAIVLVLLGTSYGSFAQSSNVETVRMILEDPDPNAEKDLKYCKKLIDEASVHPKTANSPKMWVYKAAVYFEIARKPDQPIYFETPAAIKIAADALLKCHETDLKKAWSDQFDFYLLNVANVLFNAGVGKYQSKSYDTAIDYYQTTLKFIPLDTKGDLKTINITEDLIYQYSYYSAMAKGDNVQTKNYINKLIERNFNDPKIYSALAKVNLEDKDTSAALEALAKGRTKYTSDQDLLNMELDIYLKQGKTDVLIKKLDDAIAENDQNEIYYFARGATYDKLNKIDLAEKDYLKAMEIKPDYYDAVYNLGVLEVNHKANPLIEKLKVTYKKAEIEALDAQITVLYTKGLVYFEKCLEMGVPNNDKSELISLLTNMQRLYKNIGNSAKEAEMKELKAQAEARK